MTTFAKKTLCTCFLAFLLAVGIAFCGQVQKSPKAEQAKSASAVIQAEESVVPAKVNNNVVTVYYFHGYQRCPTCYKLENYSHDAVQAAFADAMKSGKVVWKVVNVEEKGNEHYMQDYKLYSKSVVVSIANSGKETNWKNLDKIWELVGDEIKFKQYIFSEVSACVAGRCL
jgi:hypothetical protein